MTQLRFDSREIRTLGKNNEPMFDWICEQVESTSFRVRSYGKGISFSWPIHTGLDSLGALDPWPASKWPKACLAMFYIREIAQSFDCFAKAIGK